jgi:hypothetical protein
MREDETMANEQPPAAVDLDALEPGIVFDVLVAERVFGHTVVKDPVNYREYQLEQAGRGGADVPHYSTDIAAAWKIVEQFEFFELTTPNRKGELRWRAVFDRQLPPAGFAHGFGDSAPLAICGAALRALEAAP